MAREIPKGAVAPRFGRPAPGADADDREPWTVDVELVTPLFGGGVEPRRIDSITPISGKSIRGQLRFWWRLFCAPTLDNPTGLHEIELMYAREAEIFGSSEVAGPFDVVISNVCDDHRSHWNQYADASYALFPLMQKGEPEYLYKQGLKFSLALSWISPERFRSRVRTLQKQRKEANRKRARKPSQPLPEPWDSIETLQEQLRVARWAWLNFGGIGGRTRRGLGVLQVITRNTNRFFSLASRDQLRHALPLGPASLEIYRGPLSGTDRAAAVDAWVAAIQLYRAFRQERGAPRNKRIVAYDPQAGRYRVKTLAPAGRSRWPEPDVIRAITSSSLAGGAVHLRDGVIVPSPEPSDEQVTYRDHRTAVNAQPYAAFPRAILGLPIGFHFADSPNQISKAAGIPPAEMDPPDVTLVRAGFGPTDSDRMASPVITRPIRIGAAWYPALIILRTPELGRLSAQLKATESRTILHPVPHSEIENSDFGAYPPMRGKSNALCALIEFAQSKQFKRFPEER